MSAESFSSGVCSQRNEDEYEVETLQRSTLEQLKVSQLRQIAARTPGVDQDRVTDSDDIEDAVDRREALISVILDAPSGASMKGKLFNDCVHDHYELPHLCVKVMDTPEFQRLRDLKQLGGTYGVFTCASHNRFEHSLGTAHLAGYVATQLSKLQPALGITEKDVLCCQLAGLCHDLGHGPMSHMFDGKFLNTMMKIRGDSSVPPHEELSTRMLDHLIVENQLWGEFERAGLDATDLLFIKEMIDHQARGELPSVGAMGDGEKPAGEPWRLYAGRPPEKHFLYEIISNDVNGVDVDKFDYFMRDAKLLNIPITFDPKRLMANTRVARSARDGKLHIAFQIKEAWNLYELFHTRYTLHKRAYQHKTANSIEEMLCEVMVLAEDHLRIYRGSEIDSRTGQLKVYTPYETLKDMGAYAKLADSVFHDIEVSLKEELRPAQELLRKVKRRELYPFIGESVIRQGSATKKPNSVWKGVVRAGVMKILSNQDKLISALREHCPQQTGSADDDFPRSDRLEQMLRVATQLVTRSNSGEDDLIVSIVKINYGMKDKDPVRSALFYDQEKDEDGGDIPAGIYLESERISSMVPKAFEEKYIRLYSRIFESSISGLGEEDCKMVKPVLRSAFFAWAREEEDDARLVEPPTPARTSYSGASALQCSAASEKLERHRLIPMLEEHQTTKRERQTPAKSSSDSLCNEASETNSGNTNAAKKRLKLK